MRACRACARPLHWAKHHRTGRPMPLNTDSVIPFSHGAFTLIGGIAYAGDEAIAVVAEVAAIDAESARRQLEDADWFTSHFSDCPGAERFRR